MNTLRKSLRLSWSEWWLLTQASVLLPMTALMLRLTGLRRYKLILSSLASSDSAPKEDQTEMVLAQALRISWLVKVAVRYGIYPANCLQRSLVLWWLLHQQGIRSELHIGTRKDSGRFEAHAWIEIAGFVLNDTDDVRQRFAPFDRPVALS
ncbi:MAG: lasso peptide biosynthesis B2 protein [Blastocatellia bacterium]